MSCENSSRGNSEDCQHAEPSWFPWFRLDFVSDFPPDANLVFDVRFLPNPNYVPRLKSKTGRDAVVQRFMDSFPSTREFMKHLMEMLLYLLPNYMQEGKSYLTIAIGCTGGRHRSVAMRKRSAAPWPVRGIRQGVAPRYWEGMKCR